MPLGGRMVAGNKAKQRRAAAPAVDAAAIEGDALAAETIEQFRGDRDFIFGLARGFAVLLSLSTTRRHMTISQVARRTGLTRPSARRCLHTLEQIGFAASDGIGGYYLRPRVLSFSHTYLSASPIALLAQPLLDELSNSTLQACALAVLDGDDIAYLARSMSSPIIAPHLNVGRRQPAYCTSIGHILLANLPKSQLDQYLSRIRFYQYTVHTINSKAKLRAAVDDARTSDLAYVSQQTGPNLCSLAVAVRDESGACIAGINLIVHGAVLSAAEMTSRYLSSLKQAAASLGLVLPSNAC